MAALGSATARSNDLTKAGVITVVASANGDTGLKTKLDAIRGIDSIVLFEGKDYVLSGAQALVARIGSGTSGVLSGTGQITVDDSGSTSGTRLDLTRLVLDANDSLSLGAGNYDLNSALARKAAGTLGAAGTVNLWASSQGEDLYGIAAAPLDNIYLTASRDYTLGLDQVTKAKVTTTGAAGNLTKAGTVSVRLKDGDSVASLAANTAVKGVDVLQVVAADTLSTNTGVSFTLASGLTSSLQVSLDDAGTLIRFSRSASSSATGNTGADATVNDQGEWSFNNTSDVLTFWNGAATQQVTLVGVNSVVADGTAILKIGF